MRDTIRCHRTARIVLAGLGLLLWAASAWSQSVAPYAMPESASPRVEEAPLRLGDLADLEPVARLRPASEGAVDQLEALRAWNAAGREPRKIGFARPLPLPQPVRFSEASLRVHGRHAGGITMRPPSGQLAWATKVEVEEAYRLRLHLRDVHLPPGVEMWVYNEAGTEVTGPFGLELLEPEGGLWTPSIQGPIIHLEVHIPRAALADERSFDFVVDLVGEIVGSDPRGQNTSCILDAQCFNTNVGQIDIKNAFAHLQFTDPGQPGFFFVCTGALLGDTAQTFTPNFLTANHCFDTQASASSLEAFWNYVTPSCNSPQSQWPPLSSLQKSNGSTLLTTGAAPSQPDFTLVRLNSIPGSRTFLGWSSTPPSNNIEIRRLSHPFPDDVSTPHPMRYSSYTVNGNSPFQCPGQLPKPTFLYSDIEQGGTFGGSSGAPAFTPTGTVVGQLFGGCGQEPEDGCSPNNAEVDGSFAESFPSLAPFLVNDTTEPCTPGPTTLCLTDERFKVEATFRPPGEGISQASAGDLTDDTGFFTFFDPNNVEVVIKVLDACTFNNRFWVFAAGLTNVEVQLTVTDTQSGLINTYTNPQGFEFQPVQDTSAFATCP